MKSILNNFNISMNKMMEWSFAKYIGENWYSEKLETAKK